MASPRHIKNRIKSTKNIRQITKAMEAVSSIKMKRSESAASAVKGYALATLKILKDVRRTMEKDADNKDNYLFREGRGERTTLVIITSDKGLAGAFNTNVIRQATHYIAKSKKPVDLITIGKRGRDFFKRQGMSITDSFLNMGDVLRPEQALSVGDKIFDLFTEGRYDKVVLIYTHFVTALRQKVISRILLPVTTSALEEVLKEIAPNTQIKEDDTEYLFEPSTERVLTSLVPSLIKAQIFHSILEANASEHSSRVIAMKSAYDNASELIDNLNIVYNKARQDKITAELIEITAGAEALMND